MSTLGKAVRLRRLKNPGSGRILTVALDHAPSYGVMEGLENIRLVVEQVANGGSDVIMLKTLLRAGRPNWMQDSSSE